MRTYIVYDVENKILWTGRAKNRQDLRRECLGFRLTFLLHTVRFGKRTFSASEIYSGN